jgi:transcriptional regulator with XRE-family HTH domain
MAETTLALDLRRARERAGCTVKEVATACGLTVRAVQHWERKGSVPRKYLTAIDQLFHDKVAGWLWQIDEEPRNSSPVILEMIAALHARDFAKAILWAEAAVNPFTGAPISLSQDEELLVSTLRATALQFVDRLEEANEVFALRANEADAEFGPLKDGSAGVKWSPLQQLERLSDLRIRGLVAAKMQALTVEIDADRIQTEEAVGWFRFLQHVVRGRRTRVGKVRYENLLGLLLWNLVNTLCRTGDQRDLERTVDALTELKGLYGAKALRAVIEHDDTVRPVLEIALIAEQLDAR